MRRLQAAAQKHGARKGDICWVVVDRNSWSDEMLLKVSRQCKKAGFGFGLSNPCFELWLVLHLEQLRSPLTCDGCVDELKSQLGAYAKGDYAAAELVEHVGRARERADQLDDDKGAPLPDAPTTRLYGLASALGL